MTTTMISRADDDEFRARQATNKADGLALVAGKVRENRDARLTAATDLFLKAKGARMDPETFRAWRTALNDSQSYDSMLDTVTKFEKEARVTAKVLDGVKSEARVYGKNSPWSFYSDHMTRAAHGLAMGGREASERLRRYEQELEVEQRNISSAEGRHARSTLREVNRTVETVEQRAMDTSSGSGGSWVTPIYLMDPVGFLSPVNSFTTQTNQQELPAYGMAVSIPSITSTTTVGQQVSGENTAVDSSSPSGARLTAPLVSISGQIIISQPLADRGGAPGASTDVLLHEQLEAQLSAAVDSYVLAQCIAGAGTVTNAGTFGIASLYADLRTAREQMANTAGFRRSATHLFTNSNVWGATSDLADTAGRPLITPSYAAQPLAALAAASDSKAAGWVGHQMPGSLNWFVDDSMPTANSGAETQLLVTRSNEILTWIGSPLVYSYPETIGGNLSVVLGLRAYVAVLSRHSAAVQSISGSCYPIALA